MSAARPVSLPPISGQSSPPSDTQRGERGTKQQHQYQPPLKACPPTKDAASARHKDVQTPQATSAAPNAAVDDELERLKALLHQQSHRLRGRSMGSVAAAGDSVHPVLSPAIASLTVTGSSSTTTSNSSSSQGVNSFGRARKKPPQHVAGLPASAPDLRKLQQQQQRQQQRPPPPPQQPRGARVGSDTSDEDYEDHGPLPPPVDTVERGCAYYVNPEVRRAQGTLLKRAGDPEDVSVDGATAPATGREGGAVEARTVADGEESALASELEHREHRMRERTVGLKEKWDNPPPSTGAIPPAEPRVFAATTDMEVCENAAAAEEFAKSQAKLKHRLDAQAERRSGCGKSTRRAAQTAREGDVPHGNHSTATGIGNGTAEDGDLTRWSSSRSRSSSSSAGSIFGSFNFFGSGSETGLGADGDAAEGQRGRSGSTPSKRHRRHHHSPTRRGSSGHARPSSPEPRGLLPRRESQGNMTEHSLTSPALNRMSMASCSMARVTDGALAVMEMLANRPDVVLPSPSETSVVRTGDVLSSKHVLKLDLQDALRGRRGQTGMISGAPFFRIVPKLNIAGVAQANVSAIRTIVNELRRAHLEGPIIWVNLREEPLVYINNQAHIVRERLDPLKPVIIPNVTGRSIEAVEMKLKEEVLQEAYENGGNVSVYVEGNGGLVEDQWECADPYTVYTIREVFLHLTVRSPVSAGALHYFRRPITQNVGPQPADFDFVLDACLEEPKAVFVFNCQTGRGRTSAMMQIANIVRFYQLCVKDVSVDVRVLRGNSNAPTFRTIQKLVSLFPDGKLHERRLNILMDLADKVYSMSDHIIEAFSGMDEHPEEAMMRLQQYAHFLVFSYYCEQRLWNYTVKSSFAQWLNDNPDTRLLISSVRDKLTDQLKTEQVITSVGSGSGGGAGREDRAMAGGAGGMTSNGIYRSLGSPTGEGTLDEPPEVVKAIRHRRGNVLSAGRILCSMPMASNQSTVRALRQLAPGVPIFTCGRMGGSAREELVSEIRATFSGRTTLHWLSLRAEPMVFINDVSYTLTDFSAPVSMSENGVTMHVSVQAIDQMEDRLRRDVLLEAQEHSGYIIVHHLDEKGHRFCTRLKVCSVRTPRSTMEDFVTGCNISYYRVPIPYSGQMLASDIDPLLRFLEDNDVDPHDAMVINDSEGSTRTSVALNMLLLHRASRLCDLRTIQTAADFASILRVEHGDCALPSAHQAGAMPVEASEVPDFNVELLLASTICQMLTAGSLLRTVDAAIAISGRGVNYNILHKLDSLKRHIGIVGSNKPRAVLEAVHGLRSYLLVLLVALYLDDPHSLETRFSCWVRDHSEVCNIIDSLESRGEAALKYVATDNLMKADLSRRSGDVLTANFCLKADHFPGCQKKGLRPELCGAPNFRKVNLINVYGVAIPTQLGIHNVLSLLGASKEPLQTYPGQSNDAEIFLGFAAPRLFDRGFKPEELQRPLRGSVEWVNLREEPILFVGDRPFVFRDLATPYVNVELTGIQTDKIETVENQLKVDVLNEAQRYDGKFLVHDEGNPGELVGRWEVANADTVKTLREVYTELEAKGARCRMVRLPVTDEQSPAFSDFDLLVAALLPRIAEHLDRRETLSFVFNCQMGRGRTTTGMVICSLLIGLAIPEYYDELHTTHDPLYLGYETDLWRGDYEVITQLKRALTQGRSAKYKVDLILEECSKMQNLRTAIESYATAECSPDNTEEARARAHHAGVHYLVRYFNLIVFAVYLEESYDPMLKRVRGSFVAWMEQHPELTALSSKATLK